jgi:hypothetical protein
MLLGGGRKYMGFDKAIDGSEDILVTGDII